MERILIVGAKAGQALYGESLSDPEVAGGIERIPTITFYDLNPDISLRSDLLILVMRCIGEKLN